MFLTFSEVASIARFAHKNGGTALTNIQAFALASPGVLSKLLQEGFDNAGVLDSATVKGFADDVETAFVALTALLPATMAATPAAAFKDVVDATYASNLLAVTGLQTWSKTGTNETALVAILAAGIVATGAYGLVGATIPEAVTTFATKVAAGFDAAASLAPA